jgi:hypothetical protein
MKTSSLSKLAFGLVLVAALGINSAKATLISGTISFDGVASTNTNDLANATSFTGYNLVAGGPAGVFDAGGTGTYALIPAFTDGSYSNFTFASSPNVAVGPTSVIPLWTISAGGVTFSFDATAVTSVSQGQSFLNITGLGTATTNLLGYTDTPGSFTITDTTSGTVITFGSTVTTPLPDSGATSMMIALGLAGLGMGLVAQRRKLAMA